MLLHHIPILVCLVAMYQGLPSELQPKTHLSPHLLRPLHSETVENRIVNGRDATRGEIPFQLAYMKKLDGLYQPICGASIYSEAWAITAAHCCIIERDYDQPRGVKVRAGGLHLGASSDFEQTSRIIRVIPHEDYSQTTKANDICLVKLETPLKFNEHVSPVTLPAQDEEAPTGSILSTSGWGHTSFRGSAANALQVVDIPLVRQNECLETYIRIHWDSSSMICAGDDSRDACQGDSGGPLFERNSHKLIGVTSWGIGCASPGMPGVYAKVASFVDRMRENAV